MHIRPAATALIAALVFVPCMSTQAQIPSAMDGVDFRDVVRRAKETVFPAVVYIKCLRESHEGGKRSTQDVSGSGVIVSADGEVLTNWHVVDKATSIRCLLSDGGAYDAELVGSDKSTDLALIRLEPVDGEMALPFAEFGESDPLREGDFVMAMGAPWGLNRSVSIGIISCTRRHLPTTSEYSHWLQTDAAINPGNSGGPLVDTDGRIIGINTRGMDFGDGMGFAVPSDTIQILLPQLRAYGRVNWSWTGLQLQPLRDFDRDMYFDFDRGVIVAETDPESPATRAGIQPRDRIVKLNGADVTATTAEDLCEVRRMFGLLPMHEAATVEIVRAGEIVLVELTPREKGDVEGEELDCPRWDFTVKAINQFDNEDLYFYRKAGVFVYGIEYPGNAANSGLSDNDILLKIDGVEVATLEDVKTLHADAIENVRDKHRMVISVLRGGLMRTIVLDYSRDHEKD